MRSPRWSSGRVAALTPEREATLRRLRRLAILFDAAVTVPGTQFRLGLDPLIGLIPGVGDLAGAAVTVYLVWEARRLGAPRSLVARMLANAGVDALVGAVPLVGDVFDAAFRANLRNVRLLEEHLLRAPQVSAAGRSNTRWRS